MSNTTEDKMKNVADKSRVSHRVLFTVRSGTSNWNLNEVETARINESSLEDFAKECILQRTGKAISKVDWEIFMTNHKLVRKCGNLHYHFTFDRYTMESR